MANVSCASEENNACLLMQARLAPERVVPTYWRESDACAMRKVVHQQKKKPYIQKDVFAERR